ncbi:MAG TPA: reductive dehalogenase domain-containing protein [Acidobacteriota bacterium]|nr:reductive dehalogenase domain-containing protein [Acidobacteriota bacterium]
MMNIFDLAYHLVGGLVCLFLALFSVSSVSERKPRAAIVAVTALMLFGLVWSGGYYLLRPPGWVPAAAVIAILLLAALYFAPIGSKELLQIGSIDQKFDERDVVFAREEYVPGTEKYERYYGSHPERKAADDKMRSLPELLRPGGRYYDAVRSPRVEAVFTVIESLTTAVDGDVNADRAPVDPAETARQVKDLLGRFGAGEVGIARLNPMYVYSHVGRGPEPWGTPINNDHPFVIVFTLEMDYHRVEAAPDLPIIEESAFQYQRGAQISIAVARLIRALGYRARAHIAGSNYQIILPAVAHDAGLGELGRIGYLISPKLGPRIRLGAITTDMPLAVDRPLSFGVQNFCEKCLKCADNCPSAAIPKGAGCDVRGVKKWPLDAERCIHYWRSIGTDCGLCMKVCPYSHPPTFVHNLVRAGIRRSSPARTISLYGDNLLYGKRVRNFV